MPRPEDLTEQLGSLGPDEILVVGELPIGVLSAWPEAITRQVVITGERRRHYLGEHPEMVDHENEIAGVIADPDVVQRYERNPGTANLYRRIDETHYWMIAIAVAREAPELNSVLSFRRARRREVDARHRRGLTVWVK